MSSVARSPDPCLIAIILVVSSRAGPRFVYHYPPKPSIADHVDRQDSYDETPIKTTDSNVPADGEVSSSDDDYDTSPSLGDRRGDGNRFPRSGTLDKDNRRSPSRGYNPRAPTQRQKLFTSSDGDKTDNLRKETKGDSCETQWDSFMGLKCDVWEKLLSPSPSWHKRRFEVGVNDLTFVGWPVFVKKDGTWRKRKRGKPKKGQEGAKETGLGNEDVDHQGSDFSSETPDVKDGPDSEAEADSGHMDERVPSANEPDKGKYTEDNENIKDSMTMFNLIFVLNPPILEYNLRIKETYENVIKKFGKALKSEQARVDYVWKEAQMILHVKEKCRENGEHFFVPSVIWLYESS